MAETPFSYISPIGPALIHPLVRLLETLQAEPIKAPNQVQTSQGENGYSAAIVVLVAMLFESAMNWISHHERRPVKGHPADYFKTICSCHELAADIEEVFAIRDVIVHSHIWEGEITWDEDYTPRFVAPPKLQLGYGENKRFKRILDSNSQCSQRLRLNLFPSRIWRHDAYIVLKSVGQAFKSLEARDPAYRALASQNYRFQGRACTFYEIIEALPEFS